MTYPSLLLWSLKLDLKFLFGFFHIPLLERLRIILIKYITFLRNHRSQGNNNRYKTTILGIPYFYNDRFGPGSIQRVFCASEKLVNIVKKQPVVVDVGANLGQFNLFCRTCLGAARILSIEPVKASYDLLLKNVQSPADCCQALITEVEGPTTFYIAPDSQLSSIIPPEKSEFYKRVSLPGLRLDRLLRQAEIEHIDLLKIDTEGYELETLRSAGDYLQKTQVIHVEMRALKKNSGNSFTVVGFLEANGFELRNLIFSDTEQITSVDGIFVKT